MTDTPTLASALAELQTRLPHIKKASKAQYGQYADLADISKELLPIMGKLGLSFTAIPTLLWTLGPEEPLKLNDPMFVLEYTLWHGPSGDFIRGRYPLPQGTPQTLGSAITYARRYALCAITGAVADEDDDAQAAEKAGAKKPASRGKPPERAPGNQPRNRDGSTSRSQVTDDELAATGQMTDAQLRAHNRLEKDTKAQPQTADRLEETPADDPWYDPPLRVPAAAPGKRGVIFAHFTRLARGSEPFTDQQRYDTMSTITGRKIASTNDLTAAEGIAVADELAKCRDRGQLIERLAVKAGEATDA